MTDTAIINEKRDVTATVSLTQTEYESLRKLAAMNDRSISWTVGYLATQATGASQSHRAQIVLKGD